MSNTATGIKFQCHPSEQRKLLEPAADVLFTRRHHSKVIRYKYNFLDNLEQNTTPVFDVEGMFDDSSSAHSDETFSDTDSETDWEAGDSDDTVIYDDPSYHRSEAVLSPTPHVRFFRSVSKMHRNLGPEHSQSVDTLINKNPTDFLGNIELTEVLQEENDGVIVKQEFPACISTRQKQISDTENARLSQLKSAFKQVQRSKMETLFQLNLQFQVIQNLRSKFILLSNQLRHIQDEMMERETLAIAKKTSGKLRRKNAMIMDKLSHSLDAEDICLNTVKGKDSVNSSSQKDFAIASTSQQVVSNISDSVNSLWLDDSVVIKSDDKPMDITGTDEGDASDEILADQHELMEIESTDDKTSSHAIEKPSDGASKTSIKLENVGTTSSTEAKPNVEIPPCDICTDVVPQEVFK